MRRVGAVAVLLAVWVPVGLADINYPSFPGMNLVGSAAMTDNVLRLTPAAGGKVGAAWYSQKQSVANGFETFFDFQLWGGFREGDGITFAIQNQGANPIGGGGQGIGYVGLTKSLVVEFDTWYNGSPGNAPYPNGDLSSSHVAVMSRGNAANDDRHVYSLGGVTPPTILADGGIQRAYIRYVPGKMDIYVNHVTGTPDLSVPVNLSSLISLDDGTAWVGFTAGTGFGYRNQDIRSWSFSNGHLDPLPGIISPGYKYKGHTYYLLDNSNWVDAEAKAVAMGGHLGTINNAGENQWVRATFANYGGTSRDLWIGLSDAAEEGHFVWSSGEPVTYTNWNPGSPDNAWGGQDYGYIWYGGADKWDDYGASRGAWQFGVVEIVPEPTSLSLAVLGAIALMRRTRR